MGSDSDSPPLEVFAWLRQEIADRRQIRPELIQRESSLALDLVPDSFELIELANAVEQKFGVNLEFDEVADIETLGELSDLIERKL